MDVEATDKIELVHSSIPTNLIYAIFGTGTIEMELGINFKILYFHAGKCVLENSGKAIDAAESFEWRRPVSVM